MTRFRFHVPGVPHTVTSRDYLSCAYTQKVRKLCAMLTRLGHEVYHYGCEGSDPDCTERVSVVTEEYRRSFYPVDFTVEQFRFDQNDEYHKTYQRRCVEEIKKRLQPCDFLLCAWGWGHQPIAAGLGESVMAVESGIGYGSTFAKYRVFESYSWMSHVYGRDNQSDGSWYDCVIPNFFDIDEFDFREEKEDWFLYLGRIVHRKGLDVAIQVTREIGAKLAIAGQGKLIDPVERMNITEAHVEHLGFADLAKRRDLLSRAKAVFMPTYYIEPFGGVCIEAALSGTPVIVSDWGAFPENVLHGVTGYRCRTFEQFCWAARNIKNISPSDCRAWASDNFSLDRIAAMYQEYFEMLHDLHGKGWYERRPERTHLDWLRRTYPKSCGIVPSISRTTPAPDAAGNPPPIARTTPARSVAHELTGNVFERAIRDCMSKQQGNFFFVQIGACDGVMADPLHRWIREHKWHGILIEPLKHEFDRLVANYADCSDLIFENVAVSDKHEERELYSIPPDKIQAEWERGLASFYADKNMLGQLKNERGLQADKVRCLPLNALLDRHGVTEIDLLQIDAEGYDYEIIKSLDFERFRPRLINYENVNLTETEKFAVSELLKARGYEVTPYGDDALARLNAGRRIAVWTQMDWAFGQIYGNLKKYLAPELELTLFDWSRMHPPDAFAACDLVCIPIWTEFNTFRKSYPDVPASKILFSIHGKSELINFSMQTAKQVGMPEQIVDDFIIEEELLEFLRSFKLISVLSQELHDLLSEKYGFRNLIVTRAGADTSVYRPTLEESPQLRALYPLRRNVPSGHGYNVKRGWIVEEAEKRLKETNPNIRFIFPDRLMQLDEMPDFYRQGDIHICPSHSEGGPLMGIESAACGLAQLSTPVGVMPEIVEDGVTGYLLREKEPEKIVEELCARLRQLDADRESLRQMKRNVAEKMKRDWDWSVRARDWQKFFELHW